MRLTWLLIALNLLVFSVMAAVGRGAAFGHFGSPLLIEAGALYAPLVREGQWFRALTAVFIHLSPLHLGGNLVALAAAGRALEPRLGRGRLAALYLIAGLCGSATSLAVHWQRPIVAAGASGAICGLLGAGIVAKMGAKMGTVLGSSDLRHIRRSEDRPHSLLLVGSLVGAAFVLAVGGLAHADSAAHLGGLVGGALTALLMERGAPEDARPESALLPSLFVLASVGAAFLLAAEARAESRTAEQLLVEGKALAARARWSEAAARFRRALELEPSSALGHFDLALAHDALGQPKDAEAEARRALALDGAHKEAWLALARALAQQGRKAEATQALSHAQ